MGNPVATTKESLRGELIQGFSSDRDGIHFSGGCIANCYIKPAGNIPLDSAHFDGMQGIKTHPLRSNPQYALAFSSSIKIVSCVVDGKTTPIQCVFSSDGVWGYANVSNNILRTDGQHLITFNGLLEGDFFNNELDGPAEYPMKFLPARVGGNATGRHNIWIIGYKDNHYEYKKIRTDRPDLMQDLRRTVFNHHDTFLVEFDVPKFRAMAKTIPNAGGEIMGPAFQQLAMLCGEKTSEVIAIPDREIFIYE